MAAAWLLDFLIGEPGNRRLKDKLASFYVALEAGDWTVLYRSPAAILLGFMNSVLGVNPFSPRYLLLTSLFSVFATTYLFVASMIWSYMKAALSPGKCPVPGIHQFLEIPRYMANFLVFVFLINLIGDYFSWSLTQRALRHLSTSRGMKPLVIFVSLLL